MIARILVLTTLAAGCDGAQPETPATFEVDSLAPHCEEEACGLERPLLRGVEFEVLVRFDDPTADATLVADSSDRGVLVVTGTEAHPPEDDSEPLTYTVGIRTVGVGRATLRLMTSGGRVITSSPVRVEDPASIAIEIGPEAVRGADGVAELEVGDSLLLVATATAGDGGPLHAGAEVTWSTPEGPAIFATDDGPAATAVDESLYLSALTEGTATITATSGTATTMTMVRIVAPTSP